MSAVIADLQRRVIELEDTVRQLQKDKEDLYRDLESQLVHTDDSFWSSSSVLAERLAQAEKDRARLQADIAQIVAERDSLKEDCLQIRAAKHASDEISKAQLEKAHILERELSFYKKQCARALEERNLYSYEVEELKRANLELERNLENVNSKLEIEIQRREDVERCRQEAMLRISQLEERLVDCARIPELESQLHIIKHEKAELLAQYNKLQNRNQVLQGDLERTWLTIDQLREEKEMLQHDLDEVREEYESSLDHERNINADLENRFNKTTEELTKRSSELQNTDSKLAAAQAQAELFKEFRQQEVNEARVVDHETIARLKIQLEETEGLLSRKMAELQATIEAKVAACEAASEWESKYMSLNLKLKEFEKGDRTPILLRRSLETSSFAGSRNDRQWFRLRSRISAESIKSTENNSESLANALDLVMGLVPKLQCIRQSLESAEPCKTRSRRESLSRLESVKSKAMELQTDLESYPISPFLDDSGGRLSAHVKVGMEALRLAFYGIARLKQLIDVMH